MSMQRLAAVGFSLGFGLLTLAPSMYAQTGDTLRQPMDIRSMPKKVGGQTIGILDARIEAVMNTRTPAGAPGPQTLRSYRVTHANGRNYDVISAPGPTLRFNPGDSIRILLVNKLPQGSDPHACVHYQAADTVPARDTFPNCFHGPNYTNIHYHGMHVTPSGTGDNVLIEVAPGDSFQFAFRVPMNQASGTHWYHPHKHGAVALQVMNGMSGAIVVGNGPLDKAIEKLKMKEHVIAVQQVDSQINLVGSAQPSVKLVNGQLDPVVIMRPNEVQRWRFVNENVSHTTTYSLLFVPDSLGGASPAMFDVARDGVQFAPENYNPKVPDSNLIVAPGNRLEMFVRAPSTPGVHRLKAILAHQPGARKELPAATGKSNVPQQLMTVVVVADGKKVNTVLPATLPPLPAFLQNLSATADTAARLVFSELGVPEKQPSFFLGTEANPQMKFNPNVPFIQMPLGATQTWKVTNLSQNINHPFHIHINPFQIMTVTYSETDSNAPLYAQVNAAAQAGHPLWFDTFALPKNGSIVIRQRYDDFTGKFVTHCHILGHEERGMMQLLEIVPVTQTR